MPDISLLSYPPQYSSVNSPLVYVIHGARADDPVTYPDYKYVAELWINDVKVHTERGFPRPNGNFGVFDFALVVRGYIYSVFNPGLTVLAQELAQGVWSIQRVQLKVREEYGGTVGEIVFDDENRIYFNHYNGRISTFTKLPNYLNKPATDRPATPLKMLRSADRYYIPYFSPSTASYDFTVVSDTGTYTTSITPTLDNSLQILNVSPGAINDAFPGAIIGATESYIVTINGQTYYVQLICLGLYTNYHIHFQSQYGGIETMLFNKLRRRKMEPIEKKEYQQLPYRIDDAGVVSVDNGAGQMHEQRTVFGVKFGERLAVQTDFLTDAEFEFLRQLVLSPEIYVEEPDGILYPVTASANNYPLNEYMADRLTTLTVELEYTANQNTQYR